MLNLASTMTEIDHIQGPKPQRGILADDGITVRGGGDLEWYAISSASPHWCAVVIYVLIEVVFEHFHKLRGVDAVPVAIVASSMEIENWARVI
ncbi:hypothetical protein VTN49DRAFT_279 [Thermomyces lanuginosus]|uniref:uncharacterized protein n=1 Tax=Thermomyces lanuginosus TaxID=5541 RepID=UPI0037426447